MPKRKIFLAASRGGKVNDEAVTEIETAPSAPGTGTAEKPSNGRAVLGDAGKGRSRVPREIKTIGGAKVLDFQFDRQAGRAVKSTVADDDEDEGEGA